MGGDRRNDYGSGRLSSHNSKTDCGNDSKEGRRRGNVSRHQWLPMAGKNNGVCSREVNILTFYRSIEDEGIQWVHKVVEPITRPHTG